MGTVIPWKEESRAMWGWTFGEQVLQDLRYAMRAMRFLQAYGAHLKERRHQLKDSIVWNIEQGLALRPGEITRAAQLRGELFHRMRALLEKYDFLVCPVNQLPPFAIEIEWPREIAGVTGLGK